MMTVGHTLDGPVCAPDVFWVTRFDEKDAQGFLALLAKKKGKLLRGGTPDRNAAARCVIGKGILLLVDGGGSM